MRSIILQRSQRAKAQVAADFLQLYVEILIEIKLHCVGPFRLEGCEVLFVLGDLLWLRGEDTGGFKVQDLTSKVSSCDEVLHFVIALESISVSQELVSIVHSAERHVAAQFGDSHRVLRLCSHQLLSLQLYSHGSDVFYKPLGQLLDILERLL